MIIVFCNIETRVVQIMTKANVSCHIFEQEKLPKNKQSTNSSWFELFSQYHSKI